MNFKSIVEKIGTLTFKVLLLKGFNKIVKPFTNFYKKRKLLKNPSYYELPSWFYNIHITYFNFNEFKVTEEWLNENRRKIEENLNHLFSLFGSDRAKFEYVNISNINELRNFAKNNNLINKANLEKSLKISELIDPEYKPINWQLDFKSNYNWDLSQLSSEIEFGNKENVDIKVPWELARFNYLIPLSYYYQYSLDDSIKQKIIKEFRNQILDFIAFNPPEFGVNWINSMEAGIRAVNWIIAYDILKQAGVDFDEDFKTTFFESIYNHYRFVIYNLEWSSGMRGNHYFTNVVCLLILSSYLPVNEFTSKILLFSVQELVEELFYQFNGDGGNFEASTYYHCFVVEMLLYGLLFILKLAEEKIQFIKNLKPVRITSEKRIKKNKKSKYKITDTNIEFSNDFWKRIIKIIEFTDRILLEDGKTINIGDADSGRFLKFTNDDFIWLKSLCSQVFLQDIDINGNSVQLIENYIFKEVSDKIRFKANHLRLNISEENRFISSFNDFGLYILQNQYFRLFFRCGSIGQRGKGGHSHNDQLSIILLLNDFPVFVDTGTYVYTGNHKMRNLFRSTEMHNTLSINGLEQNRWNAGNKDELFWMKDTSKAELIEISMKKIAGVHYGYGDITERIIILNDLVILGQDFCSLEYEKKINFHLNPLIEDIKSISNNVVEFVSKENKIRISTDDGLICVQESLYSPEYGVIKTNKKVVIVSNKKKVKWKIEVLHK